MGLDTPPVMNRAFLRLHHDSFHDLVVLIVDLAHTGRPWPGRKMLRHFRQFRSAMAAPENAPAFPAFRKMLLHFRHSGHPCP
jgi:hypothetical protein